MVFIIAFDKQMCKNSFDLLLRYISPVLVFGTEHRYLTNSFCYYFADHIESDDKTLETSLTLLTFVLLLSFTLLPYKEGPCDQTDFIFVEINQVNKFIIVYISGSFSFIFTLL